MLFRSRTEGMPVSGNYAVDFDKDGNPVLGMSIFNVPGGMQINAVSLGGDKSVLAKPAMDAARPAAPGKSANADSKPDQAAIRPGAGIQAGLDGYGIGIVPEGFDSARSSNAQKAYASLINEAAGKNPRHAVSRRLELGREQFS